MNCIATERDGAILCKRCLRPFPISRAEFVAIGSDVTRIYRTCTAKPKTILPPGDFLSRVIYHGTNGRAVHGVDCARFASLMNHWGWLGCLVRGRQIAARIREHAAREGFALTRRKILVLGIVGLLRWGASMAHRAR